MCIYYDSVFADVDVSIIIKIYDHVGDDILSLTICIVILHWIQIYVLELISEFRAWTCLNSAIKHIWTFCQNHRKVSHWIFTG